MLFNKMSRKVEPRGEAQPFGTLQQVSMKTNAIMEQLKSDLAISNAMALPKVEKICVNIGVGKLLKEKGAIDKIEQDIALIAGQKPVKTLAKKSIAGFGLREGSVAGLKVTLRRKKMDDFLKRLINIIIPRMRDFRGIPLKAIDNSGNLTIGIKDHYIFPELNLDNAAPSFGLEVTIVTTAKNRDIAEKLLRILGIPLQKNNF